MTHPLGQSNSGTARETHNGLLVVFSGPSGAGKTSITRALLDRFDDAVFSVSATTRARSRGEKDGVDYHFLTQQEFQEQADTGAFLEHAVYTGNRYGTLRKPVEEALRCGRIMVLDVDVQGARSIKEQMPDAFCLFIMPPDDATLLTRLRERKRDTEEIIQRRLAEAKHEIEQARHGTIFDRFIINTDLQQAIEETVSLVERERTKRAHKAS